MQRDAYAALIKKRHVRMIPARITQMSGEVFHERLYTDVFTGYRHRRLVLMTNIAAQDPMLPRLQHDIIVPSFDMLARIHQPHFRYKLLPLLCADVETFAVLQAICASRGSPFCIEDRRDYQPLTYKFLMGCYGREAICDFFKEHHTAADLLEPPSSRRLPINGVVFDGVLVRRATTRESNGAVAAQKPAITTTTNTSAAATAAAAEGEQARSAAVRGGTPPSSTGEATPSMAAFVTTHDTLSIASVDQRDCMNRFFHSSVYATLSGNTELRSEVNRTARRLHVMAIKRIISGSDYATRQRLLHAAQEKQILVYEKVAEGVYRYAPPEAKPRDMQLK